MFGSHVRKSNKWQWLWCWSILHTHTLSNAAMERYRTKHIHMQQKKHVIMQSIVGMARIYGITAVFPYFDPEDKKKHTPSPLSRFFRRSRFLMLPNVNIPHNNSVHKANICRKTVAICWTGTAAAAAQSTQTERGRTTQQAHNWRHRCTLVLHAPSCTTLTHIHTHTHDAAGVNILSVLPGLCVCIMCIV